MHFIAVRSEFQELQSGLGPLIVTPVRTPLRTQTAERTQARTLRLHSGLQSAKRPPAHARAKTFHRKFKVRMTQLRRTDSCENVSAKICHGFRIRQVEFIELHSAERLSSDSTLCEFRSGQLARTTFPLPAIIWSVNDEHPDKKEGVWMTNLAT